MAKTFEIQNAFGLVLASINLKGEPNPGFEEVGFNYSDEDECDEDIARLEAAGYNVVKVER